MSEIKTDKLTGVGTAGDITITSGSATMQLQEGVATAKICSDQSATVQSDSFNIASGLDAGTGNFRFTLTNASARITWNQTSAGIANGATAVVRTKSADATTSVIDIETMNSSFSAADAAYSFIYMGDLA